MVVNIELRYAREPELVAIRFNPAYKFQGLAKQALRAFMDNSPFEIVMPTKATYEKQSLVCALKLDERKDEDIILFLKSLKAPKSTFVRNLMIRYITGDTSHVYQDEKLKEMAITDKCKQLRATMAQSSEITQGTEKQERKENNHVYDGGLEEVLENLRKHNL